MTDLKAGPPDIMKIILSIRGIISTTWFWLKSFFYFGFIKDQVNDFFDFFAILHAFTFFPVTFLPKRYSLKQFIFNSI